VRQLVYVLVVQWAALAGLCSWQGFLNTGGLDAALSTADKTLATSDVQARGAKGAGPLVHHCVTGIQHWLLVMTHLVLCWLPVQWQLRLQHLDTQTPQRGSCHPVTPKQVGRRVLPRWTSHLPEQLLCPA